MVARMLVRRSDVTPLTHRRADLTSETQHFEEEESNRVWVFAELRRLGVGLVTVSDANLVGLIRVACPSAHRSNATGEGLMPRLLLALGDET